MVVKIQAMALKDKCLKLFVTVKMQETSRVVFKTCQTPSSACFGVCLVYQLIGLACCGGGQPHCGSLSAYLFAVRSSGVAAPAVAALDFVFLLVSPTSLQFLE